MSKKFLCANWKMNLPAESIRSFVQLARQWDGVIVAIAPPYPFLRDLSDAVAAEGSDACVAAQNCSDQTSGAFTGEVAASLLRRAGARYVIVGHSERRTVYCESDAVVGRKLARVLEEGLRPVFCVGEDQDARDRGETEALLTAQLNSAFGQLASVPDELIIAYEPLWAIGTGRNATPEIAASAHAHIRRVVRERAPHCKLTIVYGGSVTPENADSLAAESEIEGFLVGGASLDGLRFRRILDALAERPKEVDSRPV